MDWVSSFLELARARATERSHSLSCPRSGFFNRAARNLKLAHQIRLNPATWRPLLIYSFRVTVRLTHLLVVEPVPALGPKLCVMIEEGREVGWSVTSPDLVLRGR
ncbi:hypothetical protein BHE74_00006895 [Ensete ventricosum]|nr:hypothetical protein GW17_00009638 [Ensete ventricosum]RWW84503.1 hypothetical protein BHE74_00006895 [Ensete ventricosum]RZR96855.1 hypothetical protein BHM03_00025948 [Ensete ventricosum]